VASSVVFHLAIPVMYARRMPAGPALKVAWREIFLRHKGACLKYFLVLLVLTAVGGAIAEVGMVIIAIATLCLGCAAALLPIVGNYTPALAALPATAFVTSYQLCFLQQFGPEYVLPWSSPAPNDKPGGNPA
jgi:hypothetical protein